MVRRILVAVVAAVGATVVVRKLAGRRTSAPETGYPRVDPAGARGLVEAAIGQRPERRRLAIEFEPATATSWKLLIDGPSFFPSILADIEAATSSVHILIFGFKDGEIGGRFKDLLIRKVAEGVDVRINTDAAYSQPDFSMKQFYREMIDGGVQVVANQAFLDLDGPYGDRHVDWRLDDFMHFDHRKVVVIDGRIGYVGGPGIEDHYADDRFHDVMLRLEGPIVAQLQAVYLLSWHFQGGPLPDAAAGLDRFFPELPDGDGVAMQLFLNNPGEGHLPIQAAFHQAITGASQRLYVVNPYLLDSAILQAIVDAASRGVETRVIVPADPKSLPASATVRHWFQALSDAGADVREHPQMAHAKVVLADDTVLAGTANLDALSLRKNWEMQVRIEDPAVAEHFARELFDRDVELAAPARMPSGRREKAVNAVMARLSPFF